MGSIDLPSTQEHTKITYALSIYTIQTKMLANITSYFWGTESETPCVDENEKSEKVCDIENVPAACKPTETTTTLKTTKPIEEDDWVMVQRSEVVTEGGL